MSNLRVIGLLVGLFGLFLTFKIYRGPRWKRLNFVLSGTFSLSLIAVSLNPNILNTATGMLALQMEHRGRILALLILSNMLLWFIILYLKTGLDDYRHQFDLLIRSLAHEAEESILAKDIVDKEIVIIIPAYNEAENLKCLLPRIPSQINGKRVGVLVVDDGSNDSTFEVAKNEGALYVRNRINRGQGAASRLGYDILLDHNIELGVTMDADNQHVPEDIEKLVRPLLENKYDLVIGSRINRNSANSSFLRNCGIRYLSRTINLLTGLQLSDCSSGFKAFNVAQMKKLRLKEDQFQSAEVIIEAGKKGLRVGEEPITITKRKHGESKKGTDWNYGLHFVKTILKTWWR